MYNSKIIIRKRDEFITKFSVFKTCIQRKLSLMGLLGLLGVDQPQEAKASSFRPECLCVNMLPTVCSSTTVGENSAGVSFTLNSVLQTEVPARGTWGRPGGKITTFFCSQVWWGCVFLSFPAVGGSGMLDIFIFSRWRAMQPAFTKHYTAVRHKDQVNGHKEKDWVFALNGTFLHLLDL